MVWTEQFKGVSFVVCIAILALGAITVHADVLDDHKALIQRFADINNSRQYDKLDEIIHTDFVRHCQATPDVHVSSLDEFKAFVMADVSTFPDGRVEMTRLVAQGDLVAFYGLYTGTQKGPMGLFPATGRVIRVDVSGMFRIADGKIAELWIIWDNLTVLAQLGHSPAEPEGE